MKNCAKIRAFADISYKHYWGGVYNRIRHWNIDLEVADVVLISKDCDVRRFSHVVGTVKPSKQLSAFRYTEHRWLHTVHCHDMSCISHSNNQLSENTGKMLQNNTLSSTTGISLPVKIKLYESLVISTLLYGAELWPLPVTPMKILETAHHKTSSNANC